MEASELHAGADTTGDAGGASSEEGLEAIAGALAVVDRATDLDDAGSGVDSTAGDGSEVDAAAGASGKTPVPATSAASDAGQSAPWSVPAEFRHAVSVSGLSEESLRAMPETVRNEVLNVMNRQVSTLNGLRGRMQQLTGKGGKSTSAPGNSAAKAAPGSDGGSIPNADAGEGALDEGDPNAGGEGPGEGRIDDHAGSALDLDSAERDLSLEFGEDGAKKIIKHFGRPLQAALQELDGFRAAAQQTTVQNDVKAASDFLWSKDAMGIYGETMESATPEEVKAVTEVVTRAKRSVKAGLDPDFPTALRRAHSAIQSDAIQKRSAAQAKNGIVERSKHVTPRPSTGQGGRAPAAGQATGLDAIAAAVDQLDR